MDTFQVDLSQVECGVGGWERKENGGRNKFGRWANERGKLMTFLAERRKAIKEYRGANYAANLAIMRYERRINEEWARKIFLKKLLENDVLESVLNVTWEVCKFIKDWNEELIKTCK